MQKLTGKVVRRRKVDGVSDVLNDKNDDVHTLLPITFSD